MEETGTREVPSQVAESRNVKLAGQRVIPFPGQKVPTSSVEQQDTPILGTTAQCFHFLLSK